jgi:hypothetical protein
MRLRLHEEELRRPDLLKLLLIVLGEHFSLLIGLAGMVEFAVCVLETGLATLLQVLPRWRGGRCSGKLRRRTIVRIV